MSGAWTNPNPHLELRLDDIKRRDPLPIAVLEKLDTKYGRRQLEGFRERYDEQRTAQVTEPWYQQALAFHHELEEKAPAMLERARVRDTIARYLRSTVIPWAAREGRVHGQDDHDWIDYVLLAQKLEDARPCAVWGVNPYGMAEDDDGALVMRPELKVQWANRAGLVKLCPDDAREDQQRASRLYADRLEAQDALGRVLRSAVFTLPNFPQWHLEAGIDTIFNRFRDEILYARTDGRRAKSLKDPKRRFPDIVGAWACLETPLSGRHVDGDRSQSWNVHLNVILVFKRTDELEQTRVVNGMTLPDYGPIRDAWGANIRWHSLPTGDRDAIQAALRELIKYPLQTVSFKASKDRRRKFDAEGRELTPAPPMTEWPAECFDEWWRAHHGMRRMRSWGVLFSDRVELDDGEVIELSRTPRPSIDLFDWLGAIKLSPSRCVVTHPMPDTRKLDAAQARRARGLTLIQGDKSAGPHRRSGHDPPRGPPVFDAESSSTSSSMH